MAKARYYMLGPPRVEIAGKPVVIRRRKALALLAYMAVTNCSQTRERLARLLWPNSDSKRARTTLRRALSDLNIALGTGWADTQGHSLQPTKRIWTDIRVFQERLESFRQHAHPPGELCQECVQALEEAVSLYQDDFLAGFQVGSAPEFEGWQFEIRENLRRELSQVLEGLVVYYLAQARAGVEDLNGAIAAARRWVALDPLSPNPQKALMEILARANDLENSLHQYRDYAHRLEIELGLTPDKEITTLFLLVQRASILRTPLSSIFENSLTETAPDPNYGWESIQEYSETREAHESGAEIRLVTVLFVGLKGDPESDWNQQPEHMAEAARLLIEVVHQVSARYGAYTHQFFGQGLFLVFGLHQVYEDDAERALFAAQEILSAAQAQSLGASIGVSTGRIYYQPTGVHPDPVTPGSVTSHFQIDQPTIRSPASIGPPIIGQTINLAARLQNLAGDGQIYTNQATYRQTQRAFGYKEMGKSADLPVAERIYLALRPIDSPERGRYYRDYQAQLIGREEELSELQDVFAKALRGRGSMTIVSGEAGIGKSRLVDELRQSAIHAWDQGQQLLWMEGRCMEWRKATSYWPFIDLIHDLLFYYAGSAGDQAGALVDLLEGMAERGVLPEEKISDRAALLGNLLSLRFGNAWDQRLANATPEQVQRQTFQAIYDFLVVLSSQQPLVLVFEDLHWADELSLELLAVLVDAIRANPILLICLYRPDSAGFATQIRGRLKDTAFQNIPDRYLEISLQELPPKTSLRMAESLLGTKTLPPAFQSLILEKAWGNPFYLEEAIRSMVESGALFQQDGNWQARLDGEALVVPDSVQLVILSRVDRLSQDKKIVLRNAAVIGKRFQIPLLKSVVPAKMPIEKALKALEDAALIFRQRVVPQVEYSFKHALIQETIYQTIAGKQLFEMHNLVAQAIEAQVIKPGIRSNMGSAAANSDPLQDAPNGERLEELAYHYQRSHDDNKAIDYSIKAGEKARSSYRNKEAIGYFASALERWEAVYGEVREGRGHRKLSALTGLGRTYHRMGDDIQAERYLINAIAVGQALELETLSLVRLYYWLGEILHWQGRYREQIHLGLVGRDLLSEEQSKILEAALMNQIIAIGYLAQGDEAAFHKLTIQTAEFIQELPYSEELRPVYVHIILSLFNRRQVQQADHWLESLENHARQHHHLSALSEVYDYRWGYRYQSGDLQGALETLQKGMELSNQQDDIFRDWRSLRDLAWAYLSMGDLDQAVHSADQALRSAYKSGVKAYEVESKLVLGLSQLCKSDPQSASEAFRQAGGALTRGEMTWTTWMAGYCLGQAYMESGDAQSAIHQFQTAFAHYHSYHAPLGWWFNRWPVLADLLSGLERACRSANLENANDNPCFPRPTPQVKPKEKQPGESLVPRQWQLRPGEAPPKARSSFSERFHQELEGEWEWVDPYGDSSYRVDDCLEIYAPNGRDLWHLNMSAPRLLRTVGGDFVVEGLCSTLPVIADGKEAKNAPPNIGGLLLWADEANFLRLVWGLRGPGDLSFEGCVNNDNLIAGRGLLPEWDFITDAGNPQRVWLRLLVRGSLVRALCAPWDHSLEAPPRWYSLGQVELPASGGLQTGIHAVGWIDRTIYHGAFPDGGAIRFYQFRIIEI